MPKPQILPAIEQYRQLLDFVEVVPVSALTGENVGRCWPSGCCAHLPEGERLYPEDFLTDQPERFFVAEMVREQILRQTREEIPYCHGRGDRVLQGGRAGSCASRPPSSSSATRQKGILIGKGGAMLKAIGTAARREIEAFLGTKVFLGLFVKVRENAGARTPRSWTRWAWGHAKD